jgi:hypothetical protein
LRDKNLAAKNKLPRSQQWKAKPGLTDYWGGENLAAFDVSREIRGLEYEKIVESLVKDCDAVYVVRRLSSQAPLTLRATNHRNLVAIVRRRALQGMSSETKTAFAMSSKLTEAAEKNGVVSMITIGCRKSFSGVKSANGLEIFKGRKTNCAGIHLHKTIFRSIYRKPSLTAYFLFERHPSAAGWRWNTRALSLRHFSKKMESGGRLSAALTGCH